MIMNLLTKENPFLFLNFLTKRNLVTMFPENRFLLRYEKKDYTRTDQQRNMLMFPLSLAQVVQKSCSGRKTFKDHKKMFADKQKSN